MRYTSIDCEDGTLHLPLFPPPQTPASARPSSVCETWTCAKNVWNGCCWLRRSHPFGGLMRIPQSHPPCFLLMLSEVSRAAHTALPQQSPGLTVLGAFITASMVARFDPFMLARVAIVLPSRPAVCAPPQCVGSLFAQATFPVATQTLPMAVLQGTGHMGGLRESKRRCRARRFDTCLHVDM